MDEIILGTEKAENPDQEIVIGRDWRVRRGYSRGVIKEADGICVLYFLFADDAMAFFLDESVRTPVLDVDLNASADSP